jgi:hypothetical protein
MFSYTRASVKWYKPNVMAGEMIFHLYLKELGKGSPRKRHLGLKVRSFLDREF